MKKAGVKKPEQLILKISGIRLKPKEMEEFKASVKILNEQADRLALLDPMEIEPAMIYSAEEGKR
jgi:hypothetical protein